MHIPPVVVELEVELDEEPVVVDVFVDEVMVI